jgi:hypothetical protein
MARAELAACDRGRYRDLRFFSGVLFEPVGGQAEAFRPRFATCSTARRIRLDEIFMVPVRLDCCRVPRAVQREIQYIDLFPDWGRGLRKLLAAWRRRNAAG